MADQRSYYLEAPTSHQEFDVSAAVPTVLILMGNLALARNSNDWLRFWPHRADPMFRIGVNWPRDEHAVSFLRIDLENALQAGYEIDEDMLALSKAAASDLRESEKAIVDEVNAGKLSFESECHLPGNKGSITVLKDYMSEDYQLPFIDVGKLIFQQQPLRLVGLEFLTR